MNLDVYLIQFLVGVFVSGIPVSIRLFLQYAGHHFGRQLSLFFELHDVRVAVEGRPLLGVRRRAPGTPAGFLLDRGRDAEREVEHLAFGTRRLPAVAQLLGGVLLPVFGTLRLAERQRLRRENLVLQDFVGDRQMAVQRPVEGVRPSGRW